MADRLPDFDADEQEIAARIAPLPHCPSPETLRALGQEILPEDVERAVLAHVDGCGLCRMLRADLDALELPGLSGAEKERIRTAIPGKPGRGWEVWGAIAAVLIAAVALVVIYKPHRDAMAITTPAAPASPAVATPAPTTAPASAPLEVARLEPPKLEPELVFRGAVDSAEPGADDLAPALAAYRKSDYETAAEQFAALAKRFPKSDIPPLYLGVSLLLAGKDAEAVAPLGQAQKLAHGSRRDAAAWYRAVAAQHLHEADTATLLDALCKRDGSSYARQACAAKQKTP